MVPQIDHRFDPNGEWFSGRAPDGHFTLEVCPAVNGIMLETLVDRSGYDRDRAFINNRL